MFRVPLSRDWITATASTLVCQNRKPIIYKWSTMQQHFGASRTSHITPLQRDRLHWLQCTERIQYKLCMTIFKALHGMAPEYLTELWTPAVIGEKPVVLRSASTLHGLLNIPKRTLNTNFSDRAFIVSFRVAGPAAWNNLPTNIRTTSAIDSFKRQSKTFVYHYLFIMLSALEV